MKNQDTTQYTDFEDESKTEQKQYIKHPKLFLLLFVLGQYIFILFLIIYFISVLFYKIRYLALIVLLILLFTYLDFNSMIMFYTRLKIRLNLWF